MKTPNTATDFGEPWVLHSVGEHSWLSLREENQPVVGDIICDPPSGWPDSIVHWPERAKRILACVNASAGYSTEALEGAGVGYFHKAIKEMIDAIKIKDAALEACEPAVRACAGMADPAAEIRALRQAASCLSRLVDHGHAEDCLFLNRANAPCDCGVDQAQAALAKLQSVL